MGDVSKIKVSSFSSRVITVLCVVILLLFVLFCASFHGVAKVS